MCYGSHSFCTQRFIFATNLRIDNFTRILTAALMDRHVLRLEKAKPLLEQINTGIQAARADALPQSALA